MRGRRRYVKCPIVKVVGCGMAHVWARVDDDSLNLKSSSRSDGHVHKDNKTQLCCKTNFAACIVLLVWGDRRESYLSNLAFHAMSNVSHLVSIFIVNFVHLITCLHRNLLDTDRRRHKQESKMICR